ncbi:MAG: hypothetical protein NT169_25495 [Chloroflexi bacterium]|nr:hypothetical protein [Chloroflexota bacterium]
MAVSLDELITNHWDELVDNVAKDAICQISAYHAAPIRVTVGRMERWLKALGDSIRQNDPQIMAGFLAAVGDERKEAGYSAEEMQAIMNITDRHLRDLVVRKFTDPIEQAGQLALLDAVIGSARMVLSVSYVRDADKGGA